MKQLKFYKKSNTDTTKKLQYSTPLYEEVEYLFNTYSFEVVDCETLKIFLNQQDYLDEYDFSNVIIRNGEYNNLDSYGIDTTTQFNVGSTYFLRMEENVIGEILNLNLDFDQDEHTKMYITNLKCNKIVGGHHFENCEFNEVYNSKFLDNCIISVKIEDSSFITNTNFNENCKLNNVEFINNCTLKNCEVVNCTHLNNCNATGFFNNNKYINKTTLNINNLCSNFNFITDSIINLQIETKDVEYVGILDNCSFISNCSIKNILINLDYMLSNCYFISDNDITIDYSIDTKLRYVFGSVENFNGNKISIINYRGNSKHIVVFTNSNYLYNNYIDYKIVENIYLNNFNSSVNTIGYTTMYFYNNCSFVNMNSSSVNSSISATKTYTDKKDNTTKSLSHYYFDVDCFNTNKYVNSNFNSNILNTKISYNKYKYTYKDNGSISVSSTESGGYNN